MSAEYITQAISQTVTQIVEDSIASQYAEALISVEGANVRMRYDGGDPAAGIGHLIFQNGSAIVSGGDSIRKLRLYCPSGTATVHVTVKR